MQRASTPADRENNCLIPNRRLTGLGFTGLGFGRVATSLSVGPSPVTIRGKRFSEKSTNPNPLKPNPSAADAGGMAFSGYGRAPILNSNEIREPAGAWEMMPVCLLDLL